MPEKVGTYNSSAEAAQALHRNPAVLDDIYSGDPEDPLVDHAALKREYHVIVAHLSELVMQDLEAALEREADASFPLMKWRAGGITPAKVTDVAYASFQGMSPIVGEGDYYQTLLGLQSDTVNALLQPGTSSLRRPDQAAIVARAALLLEKMGPKPEGRESSDGDDVTFVLNRIIEGLVDTDYGFSGDLLRGLPLAIAQERPGVTYGEMVRIAERSFGLLRGPASGNVPQLHATFSALRSDPADPDLTEDSGTIPIHPSRITLNPHLGNAKYASNVRDLPAVSPDPDVTDLVTVRDLIKDHRGIAAVYGCPARIDVLRNGRPSLVRAYLQTLNLVEPHWKLTLPQRPPIDLSRLDPPVDDTLTYDQVDLRNLDATVRILPSATGRLSIELSDDSYADQLDIRAGRTRISIAGKTKPNMLGEQRPSITIRVPRPPNLTARGVTDLTVDYAEDVDIEVPPDGHLRVPNHYADSRITTGPRSHVLVFSEYYHDLANNPVQGPGHVINLRRNSLAPAPEGPESLTLREYKRWEVERLRHETQRTIADNLDWIMMHVRPGSFSPELYEALRELSGSNSTPHADSLMARTAIPSPARSTKSTSGATARR